MTKKILFEFTGSGSVAPGGYNKPLTDKPIKRVPTNTSTCPCKNLPGKVTCGICNPKRK